MKTKSSTLKTICLAAVLLLFITACSKEKKVARQLTGTWAVNKIIPKIGSEITDSLPTLSFTKCKVKKEYCVGKWSSYDGSTVEIEWDIWEKGKEFSFSMTQAASAIYLLELQGPGVVTVTIVSGSEALKYTNSYDIIEHSKNNFIITTKKEWGGSVVPDSSIFTIEMSKQMD